MPVAGATDAAEARRAARAILNERRFRSPSVPRPLHGLLTTIGSGLGDAADWVTNAIDSLGDRVPGGAAVVWVILGLLVCGAAVAVARRRTRVVLRLRQWSAAAARPANAAELERLAAAAEADGRFEQALRLRFRAGLQSLAEAEIVRSPSSRPSGTLARQLGSEDFDVLAHRFDEVVYGGDPASDDDVRDARDRWPQIVAEGRQR